MFEELAYADGSTGWSTMANITSSAFAAIYTGDDAAKAMFGADGRGIHAGMLGPGRHRAARPTAASWSPASTSSAPGARTPRGSAPVRKRSTPTASR